MGNLIYLVEGSTGEWSDHYTWNVRAFALKKQANSFCKKLNKIGSKFNRDDYAAREALRLELVEAGDPNASIDYTGLEYTVSEIPFN